MIATLRLGSLAPQHRSRVAEIVRATGVFRDEELSVAMEVLDEGLNGEYELLGLFRDVQVPRYARDDKSAQAQLVGYAAFGPTPNTDRTQDLYWIAVDPAVQGTGAGSLLLDGVEAAMRDRDARMVVVETSSRSEYDGTRRFYARHGYAEVARMREFFAPADDRVIYTKRLASPVSGHGVAS